MSGPNILIIEVHDVMRHAMVVALRSLGHAVASAKALDDELDVVNTDILLISVAGEEGFGQIRRIRIAHPNIGIIAISAGAQGDDLVNAYQSGTDLVLTKPVSVDEVNAAIRSVERRMHPLRANAWQLTLNFTTLQLEGVGATVDASETECLLLGAFATSVEQQLSNEQLFKIIGRNGTVVNKTTLEVQIVRLRRKLEQAGANAPNIKSIRGVGYQLCVPLIVNKDFRSLQHEQQH